MGRRVSIRHNADGTKTKRVTDTYRTIFGTTKSETHTYTIGKPRDERHKLLKKTLGIGKK